MKFELGFQVNPSIIGSDLLKCLLGLVQEKVPRKLKRPLEPGRSFLLLLRGNVTAFHFLKFYLHSVSLPFDSKLVGAFREEILAFFS